MQCAWRNGYASAAHNATAFADMRCCCNAALSTATPLRATVSVSNTTQLPEGAPQPLLQGQTQASALPNGTISIADLSLIAVHGVYNVSVTLPDYPQVKHM